MHFVLFPLSTFCDEMSITLCISISDKAEIIKKGILLHRRRWNHRIMMTLKGDRILHFHNNRYHVAILLISLSDDYIPITQACHMREPIRSRM